MLHSLFTKQPKEGRKFVALYSDGSGADVFKRDKQGNLYNGEGEILSQTWLEDAGFSSFMYLPDDFTLWFEQGIMVEQTNDQ